MLEAAQKAGFQVFLTPDKNIRHQQNLATRTIAIVVVVGTPQWPALQEHVDRVVDAVSAAKPGTYAEVEILLQISIPGGSANRPDVLFA